MPTEKNIFTGCVVILALGLALSGNWQGLIVAAVAFWILSGFTQG